MTIDTCADESTGVLSGIHRTEIEAVRRECVELANALRGYKGEFGGEIRGAIEGAELPGWFSSARLLYDLARDLVRVNVVACETGCEALAAQYDFAAWLLEQQIAVEFW